MGGNNSKRASTRGQQNGCQSSKLQTPQATNYNTTSLEPSSSIDLQATTTTTTTCDLSSPLKIPTTPLLPSVPNNTPVRLPPTTTTGLSDTPLTTKPLNTTPPNTGAMDTTTPPNMEATTNPPIVIPTTPSRAIIVPIATTPTTEAPIVTSQPVTPPNTTTTTSVVKTPQFTTVPKVVLAPLNTTPLNTVATPVPLGTPLRDSNNYQSSTDGYTTTPLRSPLVIEDAINSNNDENTHPHDQVEEPMEECCTNDDQLVKEGTNMKADNINKSRTPSPPPFSPLNSPLTRKPLSPTPLPPSNTNTTTNNKSPHKPPHSTTTTTPKSLFPPTPPIKDTIVLFDLETTGLPLHSDICQIAAQVLGENKIWSSYLVPSKNISPGASKVNGLRVEKDETGKRVLMKGSEVLPAEGYIAGLKLFHRYLCQLCKRSRKLDLNSRVILLAHNAKRYDAPILLNAFRRISVTSQKLDKMGICFSDSLVILREIQRENPTILSHGDQTDSGMTGWEGRGCEKMSLSLKSLHRHFFHEEIHQAHDALHDVRAMRRILFESSLSLPENLVANRTFKPQEV